MVEIVKQYDYGSYTTFQAKGFATKEDAEEWKHEWAIRNYGYTPLGSVVEVITEEPTKEYVVYCKVWKTCD